MTHNIIIHLLKVYSLVNRTSGFFTKSNLREVEYNTEEKRGERKRKKKTMHSGPKKNGELKKDPRIPADYSTLTGAGSNMNMASRSLPCNNETNSLGGAIF